MYFGLSEDQIFFQDNVKKFLEDNAPLDLIRKISKGEDLNQKMGWLQNFISWKKPNLTDSGGYQVWSLSKLRTINEDGINFTSHLDGKKINLTPSVLFFTKKRFATISSSQIAVPYENPNIQKLGPYLYANFLFEYNYSKWLSTFLNIQNLTNNKNETWLGYREQGISMLFGIKSSF